MNLRDLLRGRPTLEQYEILQAADLLFMGDRLGRHYGGVLTEREIEVLTPKPKKSRETPRP